MKDKPPFGDIVAEMREFFDGAKWVAHNANFDIGFINAEFERLGLPPVQSDVVIDTLALARRKNPMGPNSLDALCRRYGIDNSHRSKHGALLDSELLAEVYIEMLGGRQTALGLTSVENRQNRNTDMLETVEISYERPRPLTARVAANEVEDHSKLVARLGASAIWSKFEA